MQLNTQKNFGIIAGQNYNANPSTTVFKLVETLNNFLNNRQ